MGHGTMHAMKAMFSHLGAMFLGAILALATASNAQVGTAGGHAGTGTAGAYGGGAGNRHVLRNGATSTVSDAESIIARSSGVPAANFGAGTLYRLDNGSNVLSDAARLGARWVIATDGAETSEVAMYTRQSGATLDNSTDPTFRFYRFGNIAHLVSQPTTMRLLIGGNAPMVELTASGTRLYTTSGGVAAQTDNNQNFAAGAGALATTATNGFMHFPEVTATPTGIPTDIPGYTPCAFNTTANQLCCDGNHDGTWTCGV